MKQICKWSFIHALLVVAYITGVVFLMQNAERIFGKMESIVGVISFLTLFTLSALVVGGLLVGKPIMLYIDGKKKESVSMLLASGGWLALFFISAMIYLAVK